jgi:hypothetical protein
MTKSLSCTNDEQKFCSECGFQLDWSLYEEPQIESIMIHGTLQCTCGQEFYFETTKDYIDCIKCKKRHDVKSFPIKEVEASGTDV